LNKLKPKTRGMTICFILLKFDLQRWGHSAQADGPHVV